jgi:hypothetical protein
MMNSVLEAITSCEPAPLEILRKRLMLFKGSTIRTLHSNAVICYKVVGISSQPVAEIRVNNHEESMIDFYKRRYGVLLERPELPAFICNGCQTIPVELSYFKDNNGAAQYQA